MAGGSSKRRKCGSSLLSELLTHEENVLSYREGKRKLIGDSSAVLSELWFSFSVYLL